MLSPVSGAYGLVAAIEDEGCVRTWTSEESCFYRLVVWRIQEHVGFRRRVSTGRRRT